MNKKEITKEHHLASIDFLNELIDQGIKMRKAQKLFFKTKSKDVLRTAKILEKEFDDLIKMLKDNL